MKKTILFLFLILASICSATITVDAPYSNGMVLPSLSLVSMQIKSDQASAAVITSWGCALKQNLRNGRAIFQLETPQSGGPHSITIIDGNSTRVISDIYIGKVILVTGQSNAEMPWYFPGTGYPSIPEGPAEYASSAYPLMRIMRVSQANASTPQDYPSNTNIWEKGDAPNRGRWSAIAWRAAKMLHLSTGEPVGVLSITYGGTPIERWMPRNILVNLPFGTQQLNNPQNSNWCQIYNAMIYPFRNFSLNAIVWYQGESNVWTYDTYADRLSAYMSYLQNEFSNKYTTPKMYCVEIAPYNGYSNLGSPFIRMIQSNVSETLNMHFIQTSDITTDISNIHPINKFAVGDRIGQGMVNYFTNNVSSIQFKISGKTIVGNTIVVSFSGAQGQIYMNRPDGFSIVTADGNIVDADAVVNNDNTISVSSSFVSSPVGIRYGWKSEFTSSVFDANNTPLSIGLK